MDERENPQVTDTSFLQMPWTIEHQLEAYARDPRHTDRHETLFWSWKQLSRWLSNLLSFTISSFPTYSNHDETHCRSVLHNIECLLGEAEIRRLSPTDCFGILIAVYLHDIGMSVGDDEKFEIVKSDAFYYSIEELENSSDPELKNAAQILKETSYQIENGGSPDEIRDNFKKLYGKKFNIYRAMALLLGEHCRGIHARKSRDRVYEWVKDSDQTQSGFSMTGIPLRIFLQLAECARLHNEYTSFKDIAGTLLECDNGFASDKYHPRFIAVLLMLGDTLDVDNNRFNPFVKMITGKSFTNRSEVHYQKHRAIRALQITPKVISIRADCAHTDELRQLRSEFDWLETFLQDCNYHWAEIAPENFCGCLPSLSFDRILLEGQEIPSDLVSSKFLISQRKAFRLLQGANLYRDRFVFLRELLQNASDATKRQYWTELEAVETGSPASQGLVEANKILPLKRYPIHIDFQIKKRRRGTNEAPVDVTDEDFNQQPEEDFHQKYEMGVLVLVQDNGTGISQEDIRSIVEVGTSHERDREILSRMPEWLRPNGYFGIGLQSVFLVGNSFQCITRTRQKECYKITFHSGAAGDGHIDVIPYHTEEEHFRKSVPYGTSFSVFVPESYREDRSKNGVGWIGADPYDAKYRAWNGIRGAAELMRQMEYYLDSQIGEWTFPVILREFPLHSSLKNIQDKVFPQKELTLNQAIWQPICEQEAAESVRVPLREKDHNWSNWLFREKIDSHCLQRRFRLSSSDEDTGAYRIEVDCGRIKIWSQKLQCFFCCSPSRILNPSSEGSPSGKDRKIRVYVKSLFVSDLEYSGNELLEYIDIQSDDMQGGLQMDRDSLTEEGETLLKQTIIPALLQTFYGVLQYINRKIDETVQSHQRKIIHALEDEYGHIIQEHLDDTAERKRILSSFKIRLSKLSRQNYVLFDLLRKRGGEPANAGDAPRSGQERGAEEAPAQSGAKNRAAERAKRLPSKSGSPEPMDAFHFMEREDAEELFSNDLTAIIDSDDYVAFDQTPDSGKSRTRLNRDRMLRALLSAAEQARDTDNDYVTIFLTDFLDRLEKILTLILSSRDSSGRKPGGGPQFNEQRQAEVRRLSDELQGYVLLYGMCFFYVNQSDALSCSECVHSGERPCYWQLVNNRIADILGYSIDTLQNDWEPKEADATTNFYKGNSEFKANADAFKTALYVPGVEEQAPGMLKFYSVAEILKNENHFAVFSTRQTAQDIWKHLLFHLSPFGNRFGDYKLASPQLTVFDVLNTPPASPPDCVERWSFLDRWNMDTIETMLQEHVLGRLDESQDSKMLNLEIWGNRRVRWMIHHYPTLSLGADAQGNNRINVLGRKANDHVFVDARTVLLLMERIKESALKMSVPRFQTTVWDGFSALKVKASEDILTITRGVLSAENQENVMLLALPYYLPAQARLPYDKTDPDAEPRTLKDENVLTLPRLLDYIREAYANPKGSNWDTLEQRAIINQCQTIVGFTPFDLHFKSNFDLLKQTQAAYKKQIPENQQDRTLVSDDWQTLLEALQGQFADCISDAMESLEANPEIFSICTSWKKLVLPVNRKLYIQQFFQKVYQLEPTLPDLENSIEQILQKVYQMNVFPSDPEEPEEESAGGFKQTTKSLCLALLYCAYYSEEEYRSAFLRDICTWWQEEIWENDPGKEGLLRYSAERTGLPVEELERLYMAQVRRILCSVLSGTKSCLESMGDLSRAKGVINSLPQESKNWIQESIRKFREGIES